MDILKKNDYSLESDGRFVIKNYNSHRPFSNFLPGIAGLYGVPMWVFYVNRGQGIASFGTRNKDNAILEFFPANKAYQMTPSMGFRTFIKYRPADSGKDFLFYEPFKARYEYEGRSAQIMEVCSHELIISDFDCVSGLRSRVVYHTLPHESLGALVRELTLTNESKKPLEIDLLDGLPMLTPYGMNEWLVKHMSRTIEAWMVVENLEKKAPFIHLRVDASDRPEVEVIHEGNYFFGLIESKNSTGELLDAVVDPAKIFGSRLDFCFPKAFFDNPSRDALISQVTDNKTPAAFSFASFALAPGASVKIRSYYGQAESAARVGDLIQKVKRPGYGQVKRRENDFLISGIKSKMLSVTSSNAYDLYAGHTYLDNVMRGGMPVCLTSAGKPFLYYVYSRKHGDLERDYNRFMVEPTYLAQGEGNYRDVNQNRRMDVWFEPRVRDMNIRIFMNLIQTDGHNPLVVKGSEFYFHKSKNAEKTLVGFFGMKDCRPLLDYLHNPFKLGALYRFLETNFSVSPERFSEFLARIGPYLSLEDKAEHGEGFWVDHWTYNLDLIENYFSIYPEETKKLLLGRKDYRFFDNDHVVQPREKKYFLHKPGVVRQFKAVLRDPEKAALLGSRSKEASWVRTRHGRGEIYETTLFCKLLCIFVNKLSSLDAQGTGVEMEAEKPSWYDALNGLPGLLGSSLCESFELKRLAILLIQKIDEMGLETKAAATLPEELAGFILDLDKLLLGHFRQKSQTKNFDFWYEATTLREKYRQRTRLGLSGRERSLKISKIRLFLEHGREKIQAGIEKSFDPKSGLYPTYFENNLMKFREVQSKNKTRVIPLSFSQRPLPFFLEGPVHALRVEKDAQKRRALLRAVRESGLYDRKLQMYKVNAPLDKISLDVGRARVFKPGWLENETIWLHMEYKWLLELLKSGMAEEYYADFAKVLVPFQPAERYGRSLLENSSFIVSTAFSDVSLHGAGFVARLSGSTAEFLNLWLVMNVGKSPFTLGADRKLNLRFEPCLASFLFLNHEVSRVWINPQGQPQAVQVPKNALAFLFLGKTFVVYHNSKRMDTFGKNRVWPKRIWLSDRKGRKLAEFEGGVIPEPWSVRVRDEYISRIDIELG